MKQILVVEDNPDISFLVSMHLRDIGVHVDIANEGNEGLRRALAEPYDLVILDLMLPGKELFHDLMIINPAIEVYLLDSQAKILAYSAPQGHVKREALNLPVIKQFLSQGNSYPLLGEDPRSLKRYKVFSAAEIRDDKGLAGYLYIILAGEAYDSVIELVKGSYILKFTASLLIAGLLLVLLFGLLGFFVLTHRLRKLASIMTAYRQGKQDELKRYPFKGKVSDEVDQLILSFNQMADRIDTQLDELRRNDATRREMVANVSHDLRTPLTSLHGYIETLLLKDKSLSQAERQQYLEIANNQSKQLIGLVTELFELARLDSCETLLDVEPFSLSELIQDVQQKFELDAKKQNITLSSDYGNDIPFAYGDIGMIQRVLDNLLQNAFRHTPKGGNITLSIDANAENISVKVADNGCGIPAEDLTNIFDRFYREEKSRQSSASNAGLGLAIVKRILDLHGTGIQPAAISDREPHLSFRFPSTKINNLNSCSKFLSTI